MNLRSLAVAVGAASTLLLVPAAAEAAQLADVDPLLGTGGGGNTVPGAAVPFGFASPSPDTVDPETSGYRPGEPVRGFSQTHVSGTGGGGKYGNLLLTPTLDRPELDPAPSSAQDERAAPGYYSVLLSRQGIRTELTTAPLATFTRFNFPAARRASVVVDITAAVATGSTPAGWWQTALRSEVRLTGARSFEGQATFVGGWAPGKYTIFFAGRFNRPVKLRVLRPDGPVAGQVARTRRRGERLGLAAGFDTRRRRSASVRVGLSLQSPGSARRALGQVRPSFAVVRARAAAAWRRSLGKIAVHGGTPAQRRIFATALYHTEVMPHDLSGDRGGWPAGQPHYEDFYTLWDTFRALNPLLTVIEPRREAEMVQSLIVTYRKTGWLPDGRIAGNNGLTEGGSNADVLIADALVKRLGGIDYRTAWRALRKDAEVSSPRPQQEGRYLDEYAQRGFLSTDTPASVSRTLEYAYDDFAVAQMAARLGHCADAARYLRRSGSWANLWNPNRQLIQPRAVDGRFVVVDPNTFYTGAEPYYEGSPRTYSAFVPHDVQGLIDRVGGDERFVGWLDQAVAGMEPGNEPGMLLPYLYIHAGHPERTDAVVRDLLERSYGTGRDGLPGNDDAGAMSAWFVWGAIGLYPNAGQPFYYIGSPLFERSRIALGGRRSFTVAAPAASESNKYVVGARLNGRPLQRAFITHAELRRGGTLKLAMAAEPNGWGSGPERPPSLTAR